MSVDPVLRRIAKEFDRRQAKNDPNVRDSHEEKVEKLSWLYRHMTSYEINQKDLEVLLMLIKEDGLLHDD